MKKLLPWLAALHLLCSCTPAHTVLTSPDGRIALTFDLDSAGMPQYRVNVDGQPFISPSALGIATEQWALAPHPAISVKHSSRNETWTQPWGENKENLDRCNEMAVTLTDSLSAMTIRFRAFDDGVAFRYEFDVHQKDSLTVTDELTRFRFASDGESWSIMSHPFSYELKYRHLPLSEVKDANTPFTFRMSDGPYGSVHEAALYDFPEMTLRRDSATDYRAELCPLPDGAKAYIPARFTTPWRTVQIADKAVDLINSAMILNLNEPSKITDTSWIKPQKYVGVWWGLQIGTQTWVQGPRHGATTENAIRTIDFAADNNLQGVLFEGWNEGWENWGGSQHFNYLKAYSDFDIDSIASYAASKGIELWLHNETGGNVPEYEAVLDSAFAYYHSLGVRTLKTGYAGRYPNDYFHHSQYGVRHYQRVVETAARYNIMIDAHEPIKDTGIRRTWPNFMTREGARGMEYNAWSDGNDATYLCTLPFVRLLSGPMDYTPGIFDLTMERGRKDLGRVHWTGDTTACRVHTTLARQIANWVIIYSPLQMASDLLENYEGHEAFEFFRTFDADCDASEALQGEIGQYIVVMRRAGDRFFLGAGTDNEARTITQPLTFLSPGVSYKARVYADKPGSRSDTDYEIHERVVTSDS
ncbi:MAG: glycoside hydrolase family 97 catalytic domain-containing protein, partial [Muribaculaceae bacterium]|nr:glycoside hydrolase family 97 catalytic domain-containing protein [Muribaculaceae bacterium]